MVRVTIRVKPGASRVSVGGAYGEPAALIVAVHAQPVDGQANAAVVAALAAALNVRKAEISVVAGQTGRTKIIAIQTDDEIALQERISALLAT
ncbi:MAG: DUF167 domain-containing protein [Actinobacteria bacterium]|nr:DUF167 domain-containing protein [Actinomycetota bacterium]